MRALWTLYQIVVGLSLLTLPWSRVWQENWFIWHATGSLRTFLLSGEVRGAIAGLGAGILLQAVGWSFAASHPGAAPVEGQNLNPQAALPESEAAAQAGRRAQWEGPALQDAPGDRPREETSLERFRAGARGASETTPPS